MQRAPPPLFSYPSSQAPNAIDLGLPASSMSFASSSASYSLVNPSPSSEISAPLRKRRKKDRACDACRRRKTKCDGPWMAGNTCSNCIQSRKPCTYVETSKPRGPPKAYITGLEDRVEELEALLKQLRPDEDFSAELGPPVIRDSWKTSAANSSSMQSSQAASTQKSSLPASSSVSLVTPDAKGKSSSPPFVGRAPMGRTTHLIFKHQSRPRVSEPGVSPTYRDVGHSDNSSSTNSSASSSDSEEVAVQSWIGGRKKLILLASEVPQPEENGIRFHGRSSTAGLVEATRQFKHMHLKDTIEAAQSSPSQSGQSALSNTPENISIAMVRRPQHWQTPSWELIYEGHHIESPAVIPSILEHFPPVEVAESLLDLFFLHTNSQFPLLHRPTFDRQWRSGLHRRNVWFSNLCLTIFAVASRWSDDPRVLTENCKQENEQWDWSKAGWKYFEAAIEIHRIRGSLFYPATLFEVQSFIVLGMFLRGTEGHSTAWTIVNVGIRKAQDIGAHRKKVYRDAPNVEDELWKRTFWLLIVFDRVGAANLGRSCSVLEEDFDIDLPLEVDDEYWETDDPATAFKQPTGIPSIICGFNQFIKLTQIMAFTMKTVYALDSSKILGTLITGNWKEEILKQLTTAMSDWLNGVPEHLRWSDKIGNPIFANQAATIYTTYYLIEMLIHRPFIPIPSAMKAHTPPRPPASIPLFGHPSAEICVNAARSCARIVEVQMQRGLSNVSNLIAVSHISAGILLVSVWDIKSQQKIAQANKLQDAKPPFAQRIDELMADVDIFIGALKWAEPRWANAKAYVKNLLKSFPGTDDDDSLAIPAPEQPETDSPEASHCHRLPRVIEIPEMRISNPLHDSSMDPPVPHHGPVGGTRNQTQWDSRSHSSTADPGLPQRRSSGVPVAHHVPLRPPPSTRHPTTDQSLFLEQHSSQLRSFVDENEVLFPVEQESHTRRSHHPSPTTSSGFDIYHNTGVSPNQMRRHSFVPQPYPHGNLNSHAHTRLRTMSDATVPATSYASFERPLPYIGSSMRRTSFPTLSSARDEMEGYGVQEQLPVHNYSYTRSSIDTSMVKYDDVNMHSFGHRADVSSTRHPRNDREAAPIEAKSPYPSNPSLGRRGSYRSFEWDEQQRRSIMNGVGHERAADQQAWRGHVNTAGGSVAYNVRSPITDRQGRARKLSAPELPNDSPYHR